MTHDSPPPPDHVQKDLEAAESGRSRGLKSARKSLKRNLRSKPPRHRRWADTDLDRWDDLDVAQRERVMPRDEGDRRRAIEQAAYAASEPRQDGDETDRVETANQHGIVIAVSNDACKVELGGRPIRCNLRGLLTAQESEFTSVLAVGDEVAVVDDGAGGMVVTAVLARRTVLSRTDPYYGHRQQVVVANADQLLIVSSWREPSIWLELVDRYIIAAERAGLAPIVCVNKADLVEDEAELDSTLKPYSMLGHRLLVTSAVDGQGIDELRDALKGRTTVLSGMSGTGKSSLLSAMQPGLDLRTGAINMRLGQGEGRHTTTQATMIRLDVGGYVVDTPGIREFGLSGLRRHELAQFFPEIAGLAPDCRFTDCSHVSEPDCAVQSASSGGTIAPSRYHSYKLIRESLPA